MELKQAIMKQDVPLVESIIKEELITKPEDIQLWIKLCLTELQFPFKDYISALQCVNHIYEIDSGNLDALILESGIKWHSFGFIEDKLFQRLITVNCHDNKKASIISYLQSWYYWFENDNNENRKLVIEKSIEFCDEFVYPYRDLGLILREESKIKESRELFKKLSLMFKKFINQKMHMILQILRYILQNL